MKNKSYLIIAIAALLVFAVGGTYAFFQILGGNTETRNVNVQTYTSDLLTFNVTDDIEIEASKENFYQNAGNLTDSTTATARLVPNSKTHEATATYNVYVVIDSNNFVYTTEAETPELLLTITDPTGARHGSIVGLNGSNGIFDITTRRGAFKVAENYEISTSSPSGTTQEWSMTVTLVNLDTDQNDNTGKILTGAIYITKEDLESYSLAELNTLKTTRTVNNEEVSTITSNSITVDATATAGSEGLGSYYFGIEEASNSTGYISVSNKIKNGIEYFESNVPTYTFTNLKDNTDYNIYAFVEDGTGFASNIYETTIKTAAYVLPSVTNVTTEVMSLSSIRVTATSQAGESAVSKYYFNCGDGNGWSEAQDSNIYTCNNLTYNTNYNVEVKVIDTNNMYSVEYVKPSEITAYTVTYTCTNCTSSIASDVVLPGGSSTANITANSNYNLTSATVSGCTLASGVATVSNINDNIVCAISAGANSVTCSAGEYLAANSYSCSQCPAGSFCPGGTYTSSSSAQGATACSTLGTGYTSEAGASANTSCYLAVSAGRYKTTATGTATAVCGTGSYRVAHNSYYNTADSCTACAGGKTNTGTGNTTACSTNCSNNSNVATWQTPTWSSSSNTVSNLCVAATCATNYEVSGSNCVAKKNYVYWTTAQGGSGTKYYSNTKPSTTYTSYTQLNLTQPEKFVRTTLNNSGTPTGHEACLYYNNAVFCLAPGLWEGNANTQSANTVLGKLKPAMTSAFGIEPNCTVSSNSVTCTYVVDYNSISCNANSDGRANCYDGYGNCVVQLNGLTQCF